MSKHSWVVSFIFLFTFFVLNFGGVVEASGLAQESSLQPTPNPSIPSDTGEPPLIVDKALVYADYHKVTVDEARRRLALQEEIRVIYREIQTLETFAGLWLEHDPTFKVVIRFTEGGQVALQTYPMSDELSNTVEIRTAKISLHELKEIQNITWNLIQTSGIKIDHSVNIKTNQVELYLTEPQSLQTFLNDKQESLPDNVAIIKTNMVSSETSNIYGGLKFNSTGLPTFSTSGFSVMSETTGDIGVTTAGHTVDVKDYLGVGLPFVDEMDVDPYDVQWHLPASYTVRPFIFDGTNNLLAIDLRHYNDQMVGETVCKYGQVTGYGCGTIDDKTFLGQFILVVSPVQDLGDEGDSGGPWFVGNTAYGKQVGQLEPSNTVFYMPINFVDILDLCVLRSPASPSVPNLMGSLGGGQVQLNWTNPDDICGHAVYRSTSPYFTPSSSNLVARYRRAVVGFNSSLGVGNTNNNYTYLIRPVIGFNETTSKRVGEFDFTIVPGT